VILVASVSCIYGLGSPEDYRQMVVEIRRGGAVDRDGLLRQLVDIQYTRNDVEKKPGTFRVRGDALDIFPSYTRHGLRLDFFGDEVEKIHRIDPLTGHAEAELEQAVISPAKHFVTPFVKLERAMTTIRAELEERVRWFESQGKLLEAQRIRMRTLYDLDMMRELGYCSGIENYSRHLTGRVIPDNGPSRCWTISGQLPDHHRRIPRHGAADPRHVQRRPGPQGGAGGARIPAAQRPRQPAPQLR
jgi:excinuclease ABC subunit B